jgi:hypothetical protein
MNAANEFSMEIGSGISLQKSIVEHAHQTIIAEFDKKLANYIRTSLADKSFLFETDDEFYIFIKERLRRVTNESDNNLHKLYLDYVSDEEPGTYIGQYSDKISFGYKDDGMKSIVTIRMGE